VVIFQAHRGVAPGDPAVIYEEVDGEVHLTVDERLTDIDDVLAQVSALGCQTMAGWRKRRSGAPAPARNGFVIIRVPGVPGGGDVAADERGGRVIVAVRESITDLDDVLNLLMQVFEYIATRYWVRVSDRAAG
jgi:hypothetical protein